MPTDTASLHGSAPDTARVALVIVDMINDLDFAGGAALLRHALPRARKLATLARRAREHGIPVIYANDNFGRWRSSFDDVVAYCLGDDVRGRPLVELLAPEPDDYIVIKPKHSAFFATPLQTLLEHLGVRRLVIGGVSGDVCILFTAHDAYMLDYELHVPSDCIASVSPDENRRTLAYLRRVMSADTTPSAKLDLAALNRR